MMTKDNRSEAKRLQLIPTMKKIIEHADAVLFTLRIQRLEQIIKAGDENLPFQTKDAASEIADFHAFVQHAIKNPGRNSMEDAIDEAITSWESAFIEFPTPLSIDVITSKNLEVHDLLKDLV